MPQKSIHVQCTADISMNQNFVQPTVLKMMSMKVAWPGFKLMTPLLQSLDQTFYQLPCATNYVCIVSWPWTLYATKNTATDFITLDRRQSKMLLTINKRGSKIARNSVFIVICLQATKWQSKTLFLRIFDLHSSILLTFSIATYLVCSWLWISATADKTYPFLLSMKTMMTWFSLYIYVTTNKYQIIPPNQNDMNK